MGDQVVNNLIQRSGRQPSRGYHWKLSSQLKQTLTLQECFQGGKSIDPLPQKQKIPNANLSATVLQLNIEGLSTSRI